MLYSLEDIKLYLSSQNSYGDIMFNIGKIDQIIARERKKIAEEEERYISESKALEDNETIDWGPYSNKNVDQDYDDYPGKRF